MNDLSPAARKLLDSHRTDRTLTPTDRKRIKQKVMLQAAALGATTAVAGKAAGMSLASKVVVVALGVTAATGVASVSLWALRARAPSDRTPSATSVRTVTEVVAPAPRPEKAPTAAARANTAAHPLGEVPAPASAQEKTPLARPRMAVIAVAAPSRSRARGPAATGAVLVAPAGSASVDSMPRDDKKTITRAPAVSAPENEARERSIVAPPDPEPELRALREARDDLRAGHPSSAYHRLEDFDRQHAGGMLAQERSALSAIALCQWLPGPQAQARAAEFLRSSPESPLAIRVRSACAPTRGTAP